MTKRDKQISAYLRDVPLFSQCSERELNAIAKLVEIEAHAPGATIVAQGEPGTDFYVLLEGHALVRRNGRRVGELQPGGYFGELAVLDPAPRNADVWSEVATTVARLGVAEFCGMLRANPAINERLLAGLARRVRQADKNSLN